MEKYYRNEESYSPRDFNIDADFVYDVIANDLYPLKEAVRKVIAYLEKE